jgi:tight adherence protein B
VSLSAFLSAVLAAAACAALTEPSHQRRLRRRLAVASLSPQAGRLRLSRGLLLVGAFAGVILAAATQRLEVVAASAVGTFAALSIAATRRRAARRRSAATRRAAILEACDLLAAELKAGQPPVRALGYAAQAWVELEPAATQARLGGDVAEALRMVGSRPGGDALAMVAAAWQVAFRTGAGLAGVLDRVTDGLRAEDATRREVVATLGAPRATARLLAVLPVFGLLLGTGIGADPWTFLLATAPGLLCLALGCALAVAGLLWVERIADAAER